MSCRVSPDFRKQGGMRPRRAAPGMQAEQPFITGQVKALGDVVTLENSKPLKSLRVAILGYRSHPYGGGQGVYVKYLSKALVDAGHQVDVISGPHYPHLDPRVKLIELPSLDLFVHGLGSLRPRHL